MWTCVCVHARLCLRHLLGWFLTVLHVGYCKYHRWSGPRVQRVATSRKSSGLTPICFSSQSSKTLMGPGRPEMPTRETHMARTCLTVPFQLFHIIRVEMDGSGVCPDLVELLSPQQGNGHLPQPPGTQDTLFSEEPLKNEVETHCCVPLIPYAKFKVRGE